MGEDAGVHEDLTDALLGGSVLLHVLVHEELKRNDEAS